MTVETVSSEIEVAVDPATAFVVFTEEMDLWWVRGPINFWSDGGRVAEVRCEPGVGGRIVEILDDRGAGGDVLVRGWITSWEPGSRLEWTSALDDVQTEVMFVPTESGTRVTVKHLIPPGGQDRGGTAWSRVVPRWFGSWCTTRDRVPHQQIDIARLSLCVSYARPTAAARWLAEVFGFESAVDLPDGPDPLPASEESPWIEFRIGNSVLILFALDGERAADVQPLMPWVYVDDLEAHFTRAESHGAVIVEKIHSYPGSSVYVAEDLEGNAWTFSQARPTMR